MTIFTIAAIVIGAVLAILHLAKGHPAATLIGLVLAVAIAIAILNAATQGNVGVDITVDLSAKPVAPP